MIADLYNGYGDEYGYSTGNGYGNGYSGVNGNSKDNISREGKSGNGLGDGDRYGGRGRGSGSGCGYGLQDPLLRLYVTKREYVLIKLGGSGDEGP